MSTISEARYPCVKVLRARHTELWRLRYRMKHTMKHYRIFWDELWVVSLVGLHRHEVPYLHQTRYRCLLLWNWRVNQRRVPLDRLHGWPNNVRSIDASKCHREGKCCCFALLMVLDVSFRICWKQPIDDNTLFERTFRLGGAPVNNIYLIDYHNTAHAVNLSILSTVTTHRVIPLPPPMRTDALFTLPI
jgi:hypothetical protein